MTVYCDVIVCRFRTRVLRRSLFVVMLVCVDLVLGCNAQSVCCDVSVCRFGTGV